MRAIKKGTMREIPESTLERGAEITNRQLIRLKFRIRKNPTKALGVAFGVGLLLGAAVRRI